MFSITLLNYLCSSTENMIDTLSGKHTVICLPDTVSIIFLLIVYRTTLFFIDYVIILSSDNDQILISVK